MADPRKLQSNIDTDSNLAKYAWRDNPDLIPNRKNTGKADLFFKILKLFADPQDVGMGPMILETPVYHGTNQVFSKFVNSKLAKDTLYGVGHYFTDSPQVASDYAEHKMTWVPKVIGENVDAFTARLQALKDKTIQLIKDGPSTFKVIKETPEPTFPNVHKVFLDIEKPFNIEADRLTKQQLEKLGIDSPIGALDYLKSRYPGIEEKFPEMLKSLGYDSLMYEGGKMYSGVLPHRVFIVNDPSKIVPAYSPELSSRMKAAKVFIK